MKNILILSLMLSSATVFAVEKNKPSAPPAVAAPIASTNEAPKPVPALRDFTISMTENGFEPNKFDIVADSPVTLKVTRSTDKACGTELIMKDKKIKKAIPMNETVVIELGKLGVGEHVFHCGTSKFFGTISSK